MVVIVDPHWYEDKKLLIHKRGTVKTKNWQARVLVPGTNKYKTKSTRTTDLKAAEAIGRRFLYGIEVKVENNIPIYDSSFADVSDEFCKNQDRRAAINEITQKSADVNRNHVEVWLNDFMKDKPVSHYKEEHWLEYVEWRKKQKPKRGNKPVADGTIVSELTTFKQVLRLAVKKGLLNANVLPTGKMPVVKGSRDEFTEAEYSILMKYLGGRLNETTSPRKLWYRKMLYHFVGLMIDTGMRPGEARRLTLADFTLDGGGDQLATCHVSIIGKRKKGKRERRIVPAPQRVWLNVEAIKIIRPKGINHNQLFIDYNGQPSGDMYADLVRQALSECNLKKSSSGSERSSYCFRHTFATFQIKRGEPLFDVAMFMGSTQQEIEKTYVHVIPTQRTGIAANRMMTNG